MFQELIKNLPIMKHSLCKFKTLSGSYLILILSVVVFSCENRIDLIPNSDLLILPSLSVKDFETVYTDSGRLKLILSAPLMEEYSNNATPY